MEENHPKRFGIYLTEGMTDNRSLWHFRIMNKRTTTVTGSTKLVPFFRPCIELVKVSRLTQY